MKKLIVSSGLLMVSALVMAKLPPLSDEAKAKAAEAASKTGWNGKMDGFLLCKSQDKVAARYYQTAKASNKDVKPAKETPPCADPGTFAYIPAEPAKPIEASGAHSPATTAASPPSGNLPSAVIAPAK